MKKITFVFVILLQVLGMKELADRVIKESKDSVVKDAMILIIKEKSSQNDKYLP